MDLLRIYDRVWVVVRQFILSSRQSLLLCMVLAVNLFRRNIKKCQRISGDIIGRDEASFIIVRQWDGVNNTHHKKLCSGLRRFTKLNFVVLLHES